MPKRILSIPGSLREGSSNHNILRYLGTLMPADAEYRIYQDLASVAPFDPGLDIDPAPQPVAYLREEIAAADVVVICTPEYAFGVPGQLKNALDWTVSSGSFDDKPVILITAALGGENAHAAMQLILGALNAKVLNTLLIQFIRSKMDSEGNVKDKGVKEQINNLAAAIVQI